MDEFAAIRNAASLYLHVDVTNLGAIRLYEKAGYSRVDQSNLMYQDFTTSLNLQDGATKGRNHFLLCKQLTKPNWSEMSPNESAKVGVMMGIQVPS